MLSYYLSLCLTNTWLIVRITLIDCKIIGVLKAMSFYANPPQSESKSVTKDLKLWIVMNKLFLFIFYKVEQYLTCKLKQAAQMDGGQSGIL